MTMAPATFSDDRRYRYTLVRETGPLLDNRLTVNFIMLNPSTADESQDDPTIRRCIGFAKRWGYQTLIVTNLFALRGPDPAILSDVDDPIGPLNDQAIVAVAAVADLIVAAWGAHQYARAQARHMIYETAMRGRLLHSLGQNRDGSPKHPLYVPGNVRPGRLDTARWPGRAP